MMEAFLGSNLCVEAGIAGVDLCVSEVNRRLVSLFVAVSKLPINHALRPQFDFLFQVIEQQALDAEQDKKEREAWEAICKKLDEFREGRPLTSKDSYEEDFDELIGYAETLESEVKRLEEQVGTLATGVRGLDEVIQSGL